ncbi:MAG: hypothetical protein R2719_05745 [Micropruina sp.]
MIACDVGAAQPEATVRSISGRGQRASALPFDLADPAACAAAIGTVLAEHTAGSTIW